jgi:hypothetical protein
MALTRYGSIGLIELLSVAHHQVFRASTMLVPAGAAPY